MMMQKNGCDNQGIITAFLFCRCCSGPARSSGCVCCLPAHRRTRSCQLLCFDIFFPLLSVARAALQLPPGRRLRGSRTLFENPAELDSLQIFDPAAHTALGMNQETEVKTCLKAIQKADLR
jgi:hypothetical protein